MSLHTRRILLLTLFYLAWSETAPLLPDTDVPDASGAKWTNTATAITTVLMSVAILIAVVFVLACCSCAPCQSQGKVGAEEYNKHTRELREQIDIVRADPQRDIRPVLRHLFQSGVRSGTAYTALTSPSQLEYLGLTKEELDSVGGVAQVVRCLEELENKLVFSTHPAQHSQSRPLPMLPQQASGLRQGKAGGMAEVSDFDDYTIYNLKANEYANAHHNQGKDQYLTLKSGLNQTNTAKSGQVKEEERPSNIGTKGLDTAADFDEYTIYDEGMLNEYGVLKAEKEKRLEGAAGGPECDFDEYTIYDEGPMNEYGLLKAREPTVVATAGGLDTTADFDDYTIYDEGQLNEYGILKDLREKGKEGEVGLDTAADFDDYTIYETGPPPDVQKEVSTGSPRKQRQRMKVRVRKQKKADEESEGTRDFRQ